MPSIRGNQFNLTTRRYDEQQMRAFIEDERMLVLDFSLADVFGDSGVVGLALWRRVAAQRAELDTFLMSCRVIGREAEAAFLHAGLRLLVERGITEVVADYQVTAKNNLVREFLPQQGFTLGADGRWRITLAGPPPRPESDFPIEIAVVATEAA